MGPLAVAQQQLDSGWMHGRTVIALASRGVNSSSIAVAWEGGLTVGMGMCLMLEGLHLVLHRSGSVSSSFDDMREPELSTSQTLDHSKTVRRLRELPVTLLELRCALRCFQPHSYSAQCSLI